MISREYLAENSDAIADFVQTNASLSPHVETDLATNDLTMKKIVD